MNFQTEPLSFDSQLLLITGLRLLHTLSIAFFQRFISRARATRTMHKASRSCARARRSEDLPTTRPVGLSSKGLLLAVEIRVDLRELLDLVRGVVRLDLLPRLALEGSELRLDLLRGAIVHVECLEAVLLLARAFEARRELARLVRVEAHLFEDLRRLEELHAELLLENHVRLHVVRRLDRDDVDLRSRLRGLRFRLELVADGSGRRDGLGGDGLDGDGLGSLALLGESDAVRDRLRADHLDRPGIRRLAATRERDERRRCEGESGHRRFEDVRAAVRVEHLRRRRRRGHLDGDRLVGRRRLIKGRPRLGCRLEVGADGRRHLVLGRRLVLRVHEVATARLHLHRDVAVKDVRDDRRDRIHCKL